MGLSDGERILMIRSAVLTQYTRVTDRQTDKQTELSWHIVTRYSMLSRVKTDRVWASAAAAAAAEHEVINLLSRCSRLTIISWYRLSRLPCGKLRVLEHTASTSYFKVFEAATFHALQGVTPTQYRGILIQLLRDRFATAVGLLEVIAFKRG